MRCRVLQGCEVEALSEEHAKRIGRLLAVSRTTDVVDASVVVGAAARRDAVVTSDRRDIARLVSGLKHKITILTI
jgi:hypothetical protein